MPNAKNIDTVAKIKERLERAKSLVLTDYTGLTHKQLELLHKSVKNAGAEYVVVKNSLLKIASGKVTNCSGPTAALFSYDDELAAIKELFKFIKIHALPKVKEGTINGQAYEAEQIATLAVLPSRDVLLSQLLYLMKANLQKFVFVLGEVKNVRQTN